MYDIIINNCTLLNQNFDIIPDSFLALKDGRIADIGKWDCPQKAPVVMDGHGKLFMPGLIDGHTHICQTLLRGRILDELPMIWTRIMLPFESGLTPEVVKLSAQLACLEMIKSGTTAFADSGGLHMEQVAQVVIDAGLRAALTTSTIDMGNAPPTMKFSIEEALSKNDDLYNQFHGAGDGRLSVFYSIRSILSCSQELTRKVFETAKEKNTNVHTHMSEYPGEVTFCLEHYKMRPLEYWDSLGLLGPNLLAAHGILLSSNEIALAGERGVKVIHCPFSNSGKGVPATPELLQQGVSVGLGTDGAAHGGLSMWNEIKIFRSVMNAHIGVPMANPVVMSAKEILKMATQGGAEAIGCGDQLGTLEIGMKADIISIDLEQCHISPSSNLCNTLLETVQSSDVQDMIVAGQLIMKDREVLTLDEKKILSEAKQIHEQVFSASRKERAV